LLAMRHLTRDITLPLSALIDVWLTVYGNQHVRALPVST
jgi:hypothetical protein